MTAFAWTLAAIAAVCVAFVLTSMLLFPTPIDPDPEPYGDVSEDRPSPVEEVRS